MAKAGTPMRTLQEWMGHGDTETTERYVDYAPGIEDANLVAAAFGPDTSGLGVAAENPKAPFKAPI